MGQYTGAVNASQPPSLLHTAASLRALEAVLMQRCASDAFALMQSAGRAACQRARVLWPEASIWRIFCGSGNNGGDGLVLATEALRVGKQVQLLRTDANTMAAVAEQALQQFLAAGGVVHDLPDRERLPNPDLVIDAVFGIGFNRAPDAASAAAIAAINASGCPVLAIDLPSGLNADTGAAPGACVRATVTLCLIAWKRGLFTGVGPECAGKRLLENLAGALGAAPRVDWDQGQCQLLSPLQIATALPRRPRDAHKGRFGHALILGGDQGIGGAALLAAEAALRSGAGRVSVATHPDHAGGFILRCPELMVRGLDTMAPLAILLARANVIAVGPGLGQGPWGRALLMAALTAAKPCVVDADALNLLARDRDFPPLPGGSVLTPHPLEAARLLKVDVRAVEADRFAASTAIAQQFSATVVLKGAGSLIADPDGLTSVCPFGNPGMASAGMGDVLTGVIAALLAQGLAAASAARIGVLAHALAGDRAALRDGERGLLASALIAALPAVLNP